MFYIVSNSYQPNTAPTNRLLGFVRGFSTAGIETTVVFIEPDTERSKVDQHVPNVKFVYLWESLKFKSYVLYKLLRNYYSWKFSRTLKANDTVLLLSVGSIFFYLLSRKDIRLYHERTEHPDVYNIIGFNKKKYKNKLRELSGLFVISTSLKTYFSNLGVKPDKIHIINMIVDNNRFIDIKKQVTLDRYIAYCGTASNNKDGVDELIRAFEIVHRSHPDVKLYIIGKTPDKRDRAGNLRLINSLGLNDAIVFTGIVSTDQMPQILKNAEILALDRPDSLQARCGFPTKLGEYLLTENVVVVTRVGDLPVFLEDKKNVLFAEQRNAVDFASKLIWALDNVKEASIIGKAGADVALKEFNYLNETKKIINVIQ